MKIKGHNFFQNSIFSALMAGDLFGSITFEELLQHGNFGLGTFDATDGELILLDGKPYQILASGDVKTVSNQMTSPFATVTNFISDVKLEFKNIDFSQLKQQLEVKFPSDNIFYALKMVGTFSKISVRSLSKQKPPFKPLKEAAKTQSEVHLTNISGDIVAYWGPNFANMILVPGFHAHFISANRKLGGHIFDFHAQNLTVEISYLTNLNLKLPVTESYLQHQVDQVGIQADIAKVESQSSKTRS
ncbi:MAG: acetolactate decarboxylase [Spiroplasma sp.]|nr:acetolactate decarboxylase [Spiroplasma sp.]